MKPQHFPAQTAVLGAPRNWDATTNGLCIGLPVQRDDIENTWHSCWKPTWREAFALLFGRRVWLCVAGATHPPVWLDVAPENPKPRS